MAILQDFLADPAVLEAGTNITIVQDAPGDPVRISSSGGGGGAGPSVDVVSDYNDVFGSSFTSCDQEFDRTGSPTTLPSGWSWVNQGSASFVERFGAGLVRHPGAAGDDVKGAVVSLSGAPAAWRAVAKLGMAKRDTNYFDAGLMLRESASGKLVTFVHISTGTAADSSVINVFGVSKYNSPTSYNSGFGSRYRAASLGGPLYMAIEKVSSSSWKFEVSPDGIAWFTIMSAIDVSSFITPDQVGFGASMVGSQPGDIACHWFRLR